MVTKNKTPAEVEAVTITMSRETAQAVKQACEEYLPVSYTHLTLPTKLEV